MGFDQKAPRWRTCRRCGKLVNCTSNWGIRWVEKGTYRVATWRERDRPYDLLALALIHTDVHELACAKRAKEPVRWV